MRGIAAGAAFLLFTPAIASAQIVVSEILFDAPGSDTGQEYVEIFNAGSAPINLTKWKVNDGSNHVLNVPPKNGGVGSMVVQPNTYVVLAADARTILNTYPTAGYVIDTSLSLSNTGGTISLLNASGTVKSSVSYTSDLGAAGDGNSLQRSIGGTFTPHTPSPGAPISNTTISPLVEIAKAQNVQMQKQASAGPVHAPLPDPALETPDTSDVSVPTGSTAPFQATAAANVPEGIPQYAWLLGALGIAFLGAAGTYVLRSGKLSAGVSASAVDGWNIVEEEEGKE